MTPTGDEIQSAMMASWQLMQGDAQAVRKLDTSADGFWNSFFSMVVALPALFAIWTDEAIDLAPGAGAFGVRAGLILRLGVIELVAWVVPIMAVAYVLFRLGRRDRIAPFVVANNWGTALMVWIILPAVLIHSLAPAVADVMLMLLLFLFIASLVLFWRLNNAVLGMGVATSTAAVAAMVFLSFLVDYGLRALLAMPDIAA